MGRSGLSPQVGGAVDVDDAAGAIIRTAAGEEQHHPGNFLRPGDAV